MLKFWSDVRASVKRQGLRTAFANQWRQYTRWFTKRGVRKSAVGIMDRVIDRWFDLRMGIQTVGSVGLGDLTIDSKNKKHGVRYQPSNVRPLRKALGQLPQPEQRVFVDFGAGKGRTLIVALGCGFQRVVGVEFSEALCDEARVILQRYQARHGDTTTAEVVACDVVEYPFRDDEDVFYCFNPFNHVVMRQLLTRIDTSLRRMPRRAWFIYNTPVYHDMVVAEGGFEQVLDTTYGDTRFVIYTREPFA